jgi:hypothetical protein
VVLAWKDVKLTLEELTVLGLFAVWCLAAFWAIIHGTLKPRKEKP